MPKDAASASDIRLEHLEPMRVAGARAVGASPEIDAWQKLSAWARPMGLLNDLARHPVFGFNNPSPSPDRKDYGYEFWIRIGPDIEPAGEIQVKEFEGGFYAVTTCRGLAAMRDTWMKLWNWINSTECPYKWRRTHELERPHDPLASPDELAFDLYLPIQE